MMGCRRCFGKQKIYICAYAYAYMVKVISLSNEAYTRLKAMKGVMSFSELVLELAERNNKNRKSLIDFYGVWKDDSEYWENFKKEIRETRNRAKTRDVNF